MVPSLRSLAPVALLALAACSQPVDVSCPGNVIASLALHGVRDDAATGCVVPPAAGWNVPATLPDVPAPPPGDPLPTFDAVFAWDAPSSQLAYCTRRPHAAVLLGTMNGGHVHAEVTLPGAVLSACASTCTPLMTMVVEGDLAGGGGVPQTFTGTLTESYDGGTGPCDVCQLPCTSTYALTGTGK
jgi:hypothetical protein